MQFPEAEHRRNPLEEETSGSPVPDPILTILVPSYNRGLRVRALATYLLPFLAEMSGRVELIVSNNMSTDGTELLFADVEGEYFKLVNRAEHIVSAEAHIFKSVELCRGRYVWFLGDDDIPQFATLRHTINLLESGLHDFLVFNSISLDTHGGQSGVWVAPSDADQTQVDFTLGATFLGYTYTIAGISNSIMLREPLLRTDWRPVADIQLIYSHVAWWLLAFKGLTLTAVNRILVYYRLNGQASTSKRFRLYAQQAQVPDFQFWTIGLIEQLIYLEKQNAINALNIFEMFELTDDGVYFRFLDVILHVVSLQIGLSVTEDGDRNRISGLALERMTDWLLRIDPGYFDCIEVIKDIHALRRDAGKDESDRPYYESSYSKAITEQGIEARFNRLNQIYTMLSLKRRSLNGLIGFIGLSMGFARYRHLEGFVAFDTAVDIDRQTVLRKFTIIPNDESIVVASDEAGLMEEIRRVRDKQTISARTGITPLRVDLDSLQSLAEALTSRSIAALRETNQREKVVPSFTVLRHLRRQARKLHRLVVQQKRVPAYFSERFYLESYPDVRASHMDPYEHFVRHGMGEGRNPNPMFDAAWYIRNNAESFEDGGAAFEHFLTRGLKEGRHPHPFHTVEEFVDLYMTKARAKLPVR